MGRQFVIKTNHHSLKFLLEQRITTPSQQKWLGKLLGYDYSTQYKKGKDNVVANACSRKEDAIQLQSISGVRAELLDTVKASWSPDPTLQLIIQQILSGVAHKPHYYYQSGILSRRDKMLVGANSELREKLIVFYHDNPMGGAIHAHSNTQKVRPRFLQEKDKAACLFLWEEL